MKGVVPGAVRDVWFERQGCHPLLADRDADRVIAGVQGRLDAQPAACPGRRDGLDDHLMAGQRPAPPVQGDGREQPVLNLVPLGGARRGKWQTVIASPVSAAKAASSLFQTRYR